MTQLHSPSALPAPNQLMRRAHLLGDFLVVAAEGGIRQAAEKIHISQSALTRRIQDLESALGASLFERTSRGMSLTPFGEALRHHAQLVALTCKYAVSEVGDLLEGEAGELRIAAGPAWAYALVPDAVSRMQAAHPKVQVTMTNQLSESTLPMLSSGLLDVVMSGLPPPRERDPALRYEPMLKIEHLVYARQGHPLHKLATVRAADLQKHPWIWFVEAVTARELLSAYFRRARLPMPGAAVETSSVQFGFRLMQTGNHLMVLPSTLIELAEQRGLAPIKLDRSLGRYVAGMVYRPSVRRLKAFEAYRDAIAVELGKSFSDALVG